MRVIRRSLIGLSLLWLAPATVTFAQQPAPAPASTPPPATAADRVGTGLLRALYVATPIVHFADGYSTLRVVDLGGREVNPLLSAQVDNRAVFAATKIGIVGAQVYLAHRLAKHHKIGAIVALAGLNVGYAMVAAHNFRVARTLQPPTAGRP